MPNNGTFQKYIKKKNTANESLLKMDAQAVNTVANKADF